MVLEAIMPHQSFNVPIYSPESALEVIHQHVDVIEEIIRLLEDIRSLRIDLEQSTRILTSVTMELPRARSMLDECIQVVHEKMVKMRSKGLFLREDSNKMGRFYIDAVGIFKGKLAWLCWELGDHVVDHYHRWHDSCSKRVKMDENDIHSWVQSLSELTFFVSR